MPNFKTVVHFLLVDFGGGCSSCCSCCSCCDRGKTKSTPSLTRLRLEFDNRNFVESKVHIIQILLVIKSKFQLINKLWQEFPSQVKDKIDFK